MGKFRIPKVGETIEYDCGCIYRIMKVEKGIPVDIEPDTWCDEHDPTIKKPED